MTGSPHPALSDSPPSMLVDFRNAKGRVITREQARLIMDAACEPVDPYPSLQCPKCKGAGTIWIGGMVQAEEACDECGGRGEIDDHARAEEIALDRFMGAVGRVLEMDLQFGSDDGETDAKSG